MNHVTAMHEVAHTVGVAYYSWTSMFDNGIWTGSIATETLREIDRDPAAEVHGDTQHFWPYGLNYESEGSTEHDLISHCLMVEALRADMGVTD